VSETGAGVTVEAENLRDDFKAAASHIINNPDLTRRAQEFAQRYAGYSSSSTVTRIVNEYEEFVRHSKKGRREAAAVDAC
jgi:hypothetical protein